MSTNIVMPQLGESVVEGTVGKWLKNVGDTITLYEPILEVITDKVTTEIPSPAAGTLTQIIVPEGITVKAGTVIALIGDANEQPAAQTTAAAIQSPISTSRTLAELQSPTTQPPNHPTTQPPHPLQHPMALPVRASPPSSPA